MGPRTRHAAAGEEEREGAASQAPLSLGAAGRKAVTARCAKMGSGPAAPPRGPHLPSPLQAHARELARCSPAAAARLIHTRTHSHCAGPVSLCQTALPLPACAHNRRSNSSRVSCRAGGRCIATPQRTSNRCMLAGTPHADSTATFTAPHDGLLSTCAAPHHAVGTSTAHPRPRATLLKQASSFFIPYPRGRRSSRDGCTCTKNWP